MSGSATLGGSAAQAEVATYVAVHMLAGVPLGWAELAVPDVPVAVSGETGGPGDDIRVELDRSAVVLEAQVKRGLRNDVRLREAFHHFRTRLPEHPNTHAFLVVDPSAQASIKTHLREDLRRIAQGRSDALREVTREVLAPFAEAGRMDLVPRIGVVELDLQHASSAHRGRALQVLRSVLTNPDQADSTWSLLFEDSLVVARERGRRTVADLKRLLARGGIEVALQAPPVAAANSDERFTAVLDRTKSLLEASRPSSALGVLTLLEADLATQDVSPAIRARVYKQLGAACLDVERYADADRYLLRSADYADPDAGVLGNMAAARAGQDDARGAFDITTRLLELDSQSVNAWQIRVQVARRLGVALEEPPPQVRDAPEFLFVLAHLAADDADWERAEQLAREALRRGRRLPWNLLVLAQATCNRVIAAAGGRASGSPEAESWRTAMEHADALATEALDLLVNTERRNDRIKALSVRGAARRFLGNLSGSERDFKQAIELDSRAWDPKAHLAGLLIATNRADEALLLLTSGSDGAPDPPHVVLHLRAHALVRVGRGTEAEPLLEQEVSAVSGTHMEIPARLAATELLVIGDRFDAAERVLGGVPADVHRTDAFMRHILYGRIAIGRSDAVKADEAYNAAIAVAPSDADRRAAHLEFADALCERREYARAADEFAAADAAVGPDGTRARYLRTLYNAGRYEQLTRLLSEAGEAGPLPAWGEELAALVAYAREDVSSEVAHLERYIAAVPDDVDRGIQLAHAYQRLGRTGDMTTLVRRLRELGSLDASQRIRLGMLSVRVGDNTEGLLLGYRGLRQKPYDYDVQRGYAELVLNLPDHVLIPGQPGVGPDTHVLLEAPGADPVEYLIVAEGPADPGRNEALPTDERVADLIGLREGDTVVRHRGTVSERAYTVKEVKPAAVHAFQRIFLEHSAQFPTSTAFQAWKIGDPIGMRDLAPLIRGVEGRAASAEAAHKIHEEQWFPLGVIATALGTDIGRVMVGCRAPGRRLISEFGTTEDYTASVDAAIRAAENASPVVLTHSALVTAQLIGVLDLVAALLPSLVVSRALLETLEANREEWRRITRDGYKAAYKDDAGLRFEDLPPEAGIAGFEAASALVQWVQQHCEITPIPAAAVEPDTATQRIETLGRESFAALSIAGAGKTMYADDVGLRLLLRREPGETASFSTLALLEAAVRRGTTSREARDRHLLKLIESNYYFVPVSAELLHNALRDRGYRLDGGVLQAVARISGPEADLASSLAVAVALVRVVATSPVGRGSVRAVAAACAQALATGRDAAPTLRHFGRLLRAQLALLPIALGEALEAVNAYATARGAGTGFQ